MRTARPLTDKWTFSTNGVSIMGRNGIPCIGFGPGAEAQAHAPNEKTWKQDLVTCAAVYAALPTVYCKYFHIICRPRSETIGLRGHLSHTHSIKKENKTHENFTGLH